MIKQVRMVILSLLASIFAATANVCAAQSSTINQLFSDLAPSNIGQTGLLARAKEVAAAATVNVVGSPTTNQCFNDLTQPNMNLIGIGVWTNQAAVAAFTYDFVNIDTQLQTLSSYFTPKGWVDFYKALQESKNMEAVKEKRLLVSAVASNSPIILQAGILNGRYSWRVQMNLLATYQNTTEYTEQALRVTMLIARTSPYEGVRGLGIIQFITESAPEEKKSTLKSS